MYSHKLLPYLIHLFSYYFPINQECSLLYSLCSQHWFSLFFVSSQRLKEWLENKTERKTEKDFNYKPSFLGSLVIEVHMLHEKNLDGEIKFRIYKHSIVK